VRIRFRLADILREYKLDQAGYKTEIASAVGCSRNTLDGLLRGKPASLRLENIERLITWLVKKDVPSEKFPGILFGRDDLWDRVCDAARLDIVLGETPVPWTSDTVSEMVATRDLEVAAKIVQELTLRSHRTSNLHYEYVRIQYSDANDVPAEHRAHAIRLFDAMRKRQLQKSSQPSVAFFVGSQRKNLLVELLMASCFGCKPFVSTPGGHRVPFYLMYRDRVPNLPSCFGGRTPPKMANPTSEPGIYYRAPDGWHFLPHVVPTDDAGVVFITFQEKTEATEVALFGFSSAATLALGLYFLENADAFWPPVATVAGRRAGAYICRLNWTNPSAETDCEVIPMSKEILEGNSARSGDAARRA